MQIKSVFLRKWGLTHFPRRGGRGRPSPLRPRPVCAIRKIRLSPPESHRRAAVKARL